MVQWSLKGCYSTTEKLYKTVLQKLMRALTLPTFLDVTKIAERLLFSYWKGIYFAKLLQIMSEWALLKSMYVFLWPAAYAVKFV